MSYLSSWNTDFACQYQNAAAALLVHAFPALFINVFFPSYNITAGALKFMRRYPSWLFIATFFVLNGLVDLHRFTYLQSQGLVP